MSNILSYRQEIYRKCIHISSSTIAILLWIFGKENFLPYILISAIILVLLDFFRKYIPRLQEVYMYYFKSVTRSYEHQMLSGASWVFIGAALTILLFNENVSIIALLVMSLSDSSAAIIGLKFGKTNL